MNTLFNIRPSYMIERTLESGGKCDFDHMFVCQISGRNFESLGPTTHIHVRCLQTGRGAESVIKGAIEHPNYAIIDSSVPRCDPEKLQNAALKAIEYCRDGASE